MLIWSSECILSTFRFFALHCHNLGPGHWHGSLGSAAASQPGWFWLAPPFFFIAAEWGKLEHINAWLRPFRWLSIRCKIETKLPRSVGSTFPASGAVIHLLHLVPTMGFLLLQEPAHSAVLLAASDVRLPLLLLKAFPCPSISGRASQARPLICYSVSDPFFPWKHYYLSVTALYLFSCWLSFCHPGSLVQIPCRDKLKSVLLYIPRTRYCAWAQSRPSQEISLQ